MLKQALENIDKVIEGGPFAASWESLGNYRVPQWYEDAKFGIFIHWGVYCVPAFANEWYPRHMYKQDRPEFEHHVKTYGPQDEFGYKDFIPLFKAEQFDPAAWADIFSKAGARFVMPVAEHHDGFSMYDCSYSDWTSVKMGPKRDIVGDLAAEVRKKGMVFSLSSHREENWWFFNGGREFPSDVQDERYRGLYGRAESEEVDPDSDFLDEWLVRTCELVDRYRPRIVWFDWWINRPAFAPYLQRFAAYYYNRGAQWGEEVAINYKNTAYPEGTAVFDVERGQLAGIRPMFWQTDTSVSKNSWCYITNHDYKTAGSIIADMVDIVSKNGALLLNIGPKPDGTIPDPERQMLLEIGHWLGINGDAIYGTRPWNTFGEGPTEIAEGQFTDDKRADFTSEDIRFTTKGDTLYAIVMAWPKSNTVLIKSLAEGSGREIKGIDVVSGGKLQWRRGENGVTVYLTEANRSDFPFALRIS